MLSHVNDGPAPSAWSDADYNYSVVFVTISSTEDDPLQAPYDVMIYNPNYEFVQTSWDLLELGAERKWWDSVPLASQSDENAANNAIHRPNDMHSDDRSFDRRISISRNTFTSFELELFPWLDRTLLSAEDLLNLRRCCHSGMPCNPFTSPGNCLEGVCFWYSSLLY